MIWRSLLIEATPYVWYAFIYMSHSQEWHDSFTCVKWLHPHVTVPTPMYLRQSPFTRMCDMHSSTCLIHKKWHDSFTCATCLHPHVCHASSTCVTWCITLLFWLLHTCVTCLHPHVYHASSTCVTWCITLLFWLLHTWYHSSDDVIHDTATGAVGVVGAGVGAAVSGVGRGVAAGVSTGMYIHIHI